MKVIAEAHTPNPALAIARAARRCQCHSDEIPPITNVRAFLQALKNARHLTPFEHTTISFSILGVSRVTSHQLVRHRIASVCQESQRVKPLNPVIVTPDTVAVAISQSVKLQKLSLLFEETLGQWMDALEEEGVPIEDQRYYMPQGQTTRLLLTMNVRELIDVFFPLRLHETAQWEIRELADKMLQCCKKISAEIPWI